MEEPLFSHWFSVEQKQGITVIRFNIARLLKEHTVETIGDELFALVEKKGHTKLLLDLRSVERVYSVSLAKIVSLFEKAQAAGGRLAICHVNPNVAEIFEIFKLQERIPIYPDEEQALKSF